MAKMLIGTQLRKYELAYQLRPVISSDFQLASFRMAILRDRNYGYPVISQSTPSAVVLWDAV